MKKMIKMIIAPIYHRIPNYYLRGKVYRNLYDELVLSENISLEEKKRQTVKQVKEILIYAYEHTNYYKKLFDHINFIPYEFNDLKQLEKIPVIRREDVMEHTDDLISNTFKHEQHKMAKVTTAGTTGKQMVFYHEKKDTDHRIRAYFDYLFKKVGYSKAKKMVVIRNTITKKGKMWEWDYFNNKLFIYPFNLTDENIEKIIQYINKKKIKFFHIYPSHAMTLSDYIRRTGKGLSYIPTAIFASSENLYPGQREFIEKYMRCKVYIHYGHSENGCVAGWCLDSTHYHLEECFGYCEIINEEGRACKEGELGEIVTTGFNNKALPLIRYGTEDYAKLSNEKTNCSEKYRCLEEVNGRWPREMLVSKSGSKIPMAAINVHTDIFNHVRAYQFYQEQKGICHLYIVKGDEYTTQDELEIYHEILIRLGGERQMDFTINYVEDVVRIPNGKYKYIIQNIKE